MPNKLEIILMRHGRSLADDEGVIEGRYDSPLTGTGRAQVERRSAALVDEGFSFDAIIASPMRRALETAQIVSRAVGGEVETDEAWMERDNGPVAGLTVEEAGERYPLPDYIGPFDRLVPTAREGESRGESAWAVQARVLGGLGAGDCAWAWCLPRGSARGFAQCGPPMRGGCAAWRRKAGPPVFVWRYGVRAFALRTDPRQLGLR